MSSKFQFQNSKLKTQNSSPRPSLTLAVTGCFGSGKSEVLEDFKKLGAAVFSADAIARKLTGGRRNFLVRSLARAFGPGVIGPDGALDRKQLASLVFADQSQRRRLERILHPEILRALFWRLRRESNQFRVVEIPLLFEVKHEHYYDVSLAVWAPMSVIKKRLRHAGWIASEIRRRLQAQMPLREKCCKADIILDNTFSRQKLFEQVKIINKACRVILEDCRGALKKISSKKIITARMGGATRHDQYRRNLKRNAANNAQ
ncbi:MAG: dephospho-CoA kinase [Elusimicrobia bacterium]|nr:dephospho-CoA kinase [Elusimicrobiota bacterium]